MVIPFGIRHAEVHGKEHQQKAHQPGSTMCPVGEGFRSSFAVWRMREERPCNKQKPERWRSCSIARRTEVAGAATISTRVKERRDRRNRRLAR